MLEDQGEYKIYNRSIALFVLDSLLHCHIYNNYMSCDVISGLQTPQSQK